MRFTATEAPASVALRADLVGGSSGQHACRLNRRPILLSAIAAKELVDEVRFTSSMDR